MIPIIVNDLLDVPALQEEWPEFKSVNDCTRAKIVPDMEVLVRRSGEDFRIKIEEVSGEILIGKVLTEEFYFPQPFQNGDWIQFEKKNVINIYDIDRWGVLY
jgi:hypothetical protein